MRCFHLVEYDKLTTFHSLPTYSNVMKLIVSDKYVGHYVLHVVKVLTNLVLFPTIYN